MAIAITEQTAVFFHSLLLGAVLGCFYDLFRITRIAFVKIGRASCRERV